MGSISYGERLYRTVYGDRCRRSYVTRKGRQRHPSISHFKFNYCDLLYSTGASGPVVANPDLVPSYIDEQLRRFGY
jgi:hypothetical protein